MSSTASTGWAIMPLSFDNGWPTPGWMLVATQGNTARTTQPSQTGHGITSFKPDALTTNPTEPKRTTSPMSWPSATAQASRLCQPVTHLLLTPHDEHGAVGVAKDRQAVRTHQMSHPAGIAAADNDQLNRAATLLEI